MASSLRDTRLRFIRDDSWVHGWGGSGAGVDVQREHAVARPGIAMGLDPADDEEAEG